MELWVAISVGAAFFQNLRSALQKHLKESLGTSGSTFSRFVCALPFAALYVWVLHAGFDRPIPAPNPVFAACAATGGLAQIAATALLVHLFSLRNFAVGTAFSKTEPVQTAVFGLVVLGDAVSLAGAAAIAISLCGVVAISAARSRLSMQSVLGGLFGRPALIGMAAGAGFGASAVCYRAASLSLDADGFLMPAAWTLLCVLLFQSLAMTLYLRWAEPGLIARVLAAWRVTGLVGASGMVTSVGWFTAMTLQNAAYVRAVGQIELVFTFLASAIFFRERSNTVEIAGIVLIVAGILLLLLA